LHYGHSGGIILDSGVDREAAPGANPLSRESVLELLAAAVHVTVPGAAIFPSVRLQKRIATVSAD